jgi:hypothetical protein
MDFILWGRLKEHFYVILHRNIQDLVVRPQAAVTAVDDNKFEGTPCGALSSALKWTEVASNTYCNYQMPISQLFDKSTSRRLTITCMLKTKCHRTYVVRYFRMLLN